MIRCKVDGCDNDARYKDQQVCQKHYFRFMRNGHYKLKDGRCVKGVRKNTCNPKGYIMIYKPGHYLSQKSGFVYEHRFLLYAKLKGMLDGCELCGKEITWKSCHVDHVDCDVKNNTMENIRPLCNACNTRRNYPPMHTRKDAMAIEFDGKVQTPSEWARDERVTVSHATIARRIRSGVDIETALFSPSKTYKGNNLKLGNELEAK